MSLTSVQTFLPFPDFRDSHELVCRLRLNKGVIEATQILNILLERTSSKAWRQHPIVKIWRGYENGLKLYKNIGMSVAKAKGIKYVKIQEEIIDGDIVLPPIIGQLDFHLSHLANLKRKALEDVEKGRNELRSNMIKILGEARFNEIDETLPYIWS